MSKLNPSRTILIFKNQNYDVDNFDGLLSKNKSKNATTFLLFDNIDNAIKAYTELQVKQIQCKYSYYKSFLRITKDIDNLSLDDIKSLIEISLKKNINDINIVNIKIYKYKTDFINSGYLLIDNINDFNKILKDVIYLNDEKTEFIKYYRFNNTDRNTDRNTDVN